MFNSLDFLSQSWFGMAVWAEKLQWVARCSSFFFILSGTISQNSVTGWQASGICVHAILKIWFGINLNGKDSVSLVLRKFRQWVLGQRLGVSERRQRRNGCYLFNALQSGGSFSSSLSRFTQILTNSNTPKLENTDTTTDTNTIKLSRY